MEKVYGSFCPDCYRAVTSSSSSRRNAEGAPNYKLFLILLLVFVVLIIGVGILILATR